MPPGPIRTRLAPPSVAAGIGRSIADHARPSNEVQIVGREFLRPAIMKVPPIVVTLSRNASRPQTAADGVHEPRSRLLQAAALPSIAPIATTPADVAATPVRSTWLAPASGVPPNCQVIPSGDHHVAAVPRTAPTV